ncbi:unnamed protein product [Phytomonas sp. EM1]|nr:unnamed protein product [Phytomonas sp. EM1]|eukprot:CCW65202.1 unnamed protein product [Phytomonas sp. isolate EM1]
MSDIDPLMPSALTLARLEGAIHRLALRLSRSIPLALAEKRGPSPPSAMHLRRLGALLRAAKRLLAQIQRAEALRAGDPRVFPASDAANLENPPPSSPPGRLEDAYRGLLTSVARAEVLLEERLHSCGSPLPTRCVGEVPLMHEEIVSAFPTRRRYYVLGDSFEVRYAVAAAPPRVRVSPVTKRVDSQLGEGASRSESILPDRAKSISTPNAPLKILSTAVESPADVVMRDIRTTIQQVKHGALQVRDLMDREAHALSTSEALLSEGVGKSRRNMREMSKIHEVYAAAEGSVSRLLRHIPCGLLVWQTLLMPLWVFLRQVLLFSLVLAVVCGMLLLMMSVGKPRVYRGVHRQPPISSYKAPNLSIKAIEYSQANYTPQTELIQELLGSRDL